MSTTFASTPAHALLRIVQPDPGASPATDAAAHKAMTEFLDHTTALDRRHNRKARSETYMIEQIFGRAREFRNETETALYCRCHLSVALRELSDLADELRDPATGRFTAARMATWGATLTDYVFDLAEIVTFLQRKVDGYVYLRGHKNASVHSWEVYLLARALAHQSVYWGRGSPMDHKAAQIAAIAVLRQAMELRFERLISVYPVDVKGKPPRLKHGFHQDFVVAHPQYFQPQGFSIADLRPVYDWASEIVHQAYQPYAWQMAWALKLGGRLLQSRAAPPGKAWSIANGVHIADVQDMQAAFETHFLDTYGHGAWRMVRSKPEALVPAWTAEMATADPTLHPVRARPNLGRRLLQRLRRFGSRRR
jgi:hypothetical protein